MDKSEKETVSMSKLYIPYTYFSQTGSSSGRACKIWSRNYSTSHWSLLS